MFSSLQGKILTHEITMLYQFYTLAHMINIMAQEATQMPHFFISYSSNKKVMRHVLRNDTGGIYL